MKVNPCGKRLLVILEQSETQVGMILLPEQAKKESQFGIVLVLGNHENDLGQPFKFPAQVGDRVMVSKYGGVEIKVGGKSLKMFDAGDILAVIEMEDATKKMEKPAKAK